jgi:O-antigen ligase
VSEVLERAPRALVGAADISAATANARRLAVCLYALHLLTVWAIAVSNILLGASLLVTLWATWRRHLSWRPLLPLVPPLALYLLCLVGSIAGSYDVRGSLAALGALFSFASLYLGVVLIAGDREARNIVDALSAVGALLACAGLAQYALGYGDLAHRIRGPFYHYMSYSGVLLLCDLLLLVSLVASPRRRLSLVLLRLGGLVVTTIALLGTLTRGVEVALASVAFALLGVFAMAVLGRRGSDPQKWRRWAPSVGAGLLVALLLLPALAPVSWLVRTASIFGLSDSSSYDRVCMIEAGLLMIRDRPLFGLGPDQVRARYPLYRHPTAPRYWVPHLHNSLLELAAEQGLASLVAYLALVAVSVRASWLGWRREGGLAGPHRDLYLASLLGLLAFHVAGLFENNWGDSHVRAIELFLLGLPFCIRVATTRPSAPASSISTPAID